MSQHFGVICALPRLAACAVAQANREQRTIEESKTYRSPYFTAMVKYKAAIEDLEGVTPEMARKEWIYAVKESQRTMSTYRPHMVDSNGEKHDPLAEADRAFTNVMSSRTYNPLNVLSTAAETPTEDGQDIDPEGMDIKTKTLRILAAGSAEKNGGSFGIGMRQIGEILDCSHQYVSSIIYSLIKSGYVRVVSRHRFYGTAHVGNRVKEYKVNWHKIPLKMMEGLAEISRRSSNFFRSLLSSLPGKSGVTRLWKKTTAIGQPGKDKRRTEWQQRIQDSGEYLVDKVQAGRFREKTAPKRPTFYHPDELIPDSIPI